MNVRERNGRLVFVIVPVGRALEARNGEPVGPPGRGQDGLGVDAAEIAVRLGEGLSEVPRKVTPRRRLPKIEERADDVVRSRIRQTERRVVPVRVGRLVGGFKLVDTARCKI